MGTPAPDIKFVEKGEYVSSFYKYFNCSSKEELYEKYKNNEVQELTQYFEYLKSKNNQDQIRNEADMVDFLNTYAPGENELQIVMLDSNAQIRKFKNFDFNEAYDNIKGILKETYDSIATRFIITVNLSKDSKKLSTSFDIMEEIADKLENIGYSTHTMQIINKDNEIISDCYENIGKYIPKSTSRRFLPNDIKFSYFLNDEHKEFIDYMAKEELRGLNLIDDREKIKDILIKVYSSLSQEKLGIILYDEKNNIKDISNLFVGKINSSPVDLRVITGVLLNNDIKGIELVHNHPSGSLRPSRQDINLTEGVEKLTELLEKRMTDHYIVAKGSILSFKDEGMIEKPLKNNTIKAEKVEEKHRKFRKITKRKKEEELEL